MSQLLLNSHFFQTSPRSIICQNKLIKLNYQRERKERTHQIWSGLKHLWWFMFNTLYKIVILYIVGGFLWGRGGGIPFLTSTAIVFNSRLRKFRQFLTESLLHCRHCNQGHLYSYPTPASPGPAFLHILTLHEAPWVISPQSPQYSTLRAFLLKSSPLYSLLPPPFYKPKSPEPLSTPAMVRAPTVGTLN